MHDPNRSSNSNVEDIVAAGQVRDQSSRNMHQTELSSLSRKKTLTEKTTSAVSDMTRLMICGGLAGVIAKTATNPLERIKMLSQTGDHLQTSKTNSVIGIYKTIIQQEGVIGLWAGNGVNIIRVFPAKAVVFSSNDMYRKLMAKVHAFVTPIIQDKRGISTTASSTSEITSKNNLPPVYSFFAGGMAGMSATLVTYPLDFARGRISGKLGKTYNGIIQTLAITIKDEGFRALYKGVTPTLLGTFRFPFS